MGSLSVVLFEHASGYALFGVREFEEIAAFSAQVEEAIKDAATFQSVVSLSAFYPFASAAEALANANAVSEGIASEELKRFLQLNLPKKMKKKVLGVSDAKLGGSISEALGLKVSHVGVVPEVLRGVRMHFERIVRGVTRDVVLKSQLGLGHAYSRAKVKFNVQKADNMIIQAIALVDQLDKNINTFAMRMREWYSYHFPELVKIVNDNQLFARCVQIVNDRKQLDHEKAMEKLEEVLMDASKAKAVLEASKASMGMDISPLDLMNIQHFAKRVVSLSEYRQQMIGYLSDKMKSVAPNLATLIGDSVGARLISHAGSLTNLAKYPASTVQILGAEKALFRALKTRGNTPKYGLIFHSTFIGRAGAKNKGRISRYLANKCSIASRIDCFRESATNIFGEKLREQVEDRLKFYETGDLPKKNVDVMHEAIETARKEQEEFETVEKKKKKKKKRKAEDGEDEKAADNAEDEAPPAKKKSKKAKSDDTEKAAENTEKEASPTKKKSKKKNKGGD